MKTTGKSVRGISKSLFPVVFVLLIGVAVNASAAVRTWTGAGTDSLASTPENWTDNTAPVAGDSVVFDDSHAGNAQTNVTWDVDPGETGFASWTQTEDYSATVTIMTEYPDIPGGTGFTNLCVSGDVTLDGGVWTHQTNTGGDDEHDRLSVTVGGNFTLSSNATLNVYGCGFASESGWGAGRRTQRYSDYGKGASHGGAGAHGSAVPTAPCYGSITLPVTLGSGAENRGGGAIWLEIAGHAEIEGNMVADGAYAGTNPHMRGGNAGGSIYVRAATITGKGQLSASGSEGYWSGGGGRISLIATNGTSLGSIQTQAIPGHPRSVRGTAGTIYRQKLVEGLPQGTLLIDQQGGASMAGIYTELMPSYETYETPPVIGGEIEDVTLVLTNSAVAGLTSSLRMGDFTWISSDSTLLLNDFFLYLKADEPAGDFPDDYGDGTIEYGDGDIIWGDELPREVLLLSAGPNGSVSRDPDSPDDLYDFGTEVDISAHADQGHTFVFWTGDIPEEADRTQTPLTVTMDQPRDIRALFASTEADTYTWTGDGDDNLASTASNWYPAVTPSAGAHIILNATSDKEIFWDLDVELASWTQEDGYTYGFDPVLGHWGRVVFWTEYPDLDPPGTGFTNLHVTGDVTVEDGLWTHRANRGDNDAWDRLAVTTDGDFTLADNAVIDVVAKGFAPGRGPAPANHTQRSAGDGVGASHGGQGAYGTNAVPVPTYGSFSAPTMLGSGGSTYYGTWIGGGAVLVHAGGVLTIDGDITADSGYVRDLNPGGSGGSIYLRGSSLSGTGHLSARGARGYQGGGGGRIAVVLSGDNDFGEREFDASASSAYSGNRAAAAGTVYLEGVTPGSGRRETRLLVDNRSVDSTPGRVRTPFPPDLDIPHAAPVYQEGYHATLMITNRAEVVLNHDTRMLNLYLSTNTATRLHLEGNTLYLRSPYHPDWGHEDWVNYDGGEIVWTKRGSILMVR